MIMNYFSNSFHWPLGSAFLKLLNLHQSFHPDQSPPPPSTPDSSHNPNEPTHPSLDQSDPDLDGSPIHSDNEDQDDYDELSNDPIQDHHSNPHSTHPEEDHHEEEEQEEEEEEDDDDDDQRLEELLVDRKSPYSDPASQRPSSSSYHHLPSHPTTLNLASKRKKYLPVADKRSYARPLARSDRGPNLRHVPPIETTASLTHRFGIKPVAKPFRTSSNSIECTNQVQWGPKRHRRRSPPPDHLPSSQPHKRPRPVKPSTKLIASDLSRWPRDFWQENNHGPHDLQSPYSKDFNWPPHPLIPPDHNSNREKEDTPTTHPPHLSHASHRPSGVKEWKKRAVEVGLVKPNSLTRPDFREHVEETERRWMDEFRHLQQSKHAAASTSSSLQPSPQPASVSRSAPDLSDLDFYLLPGLDLELKAAIYRVVHSWVNRALAEAFCRLGLWLQSKHQWPACQWGSMKVDQLSEAVDRTYSRGVDFLLRSCKADQFMDLLQKPVRSGIFYIQQDPNTNDWYVKLGKDFTPVGLLYRPLIKALRKHFSTTGCCTIPANKLVRKYLISNSHDEEDLSYLFKNDKDPFGCLRRAQKDGVIDIQGPQSGPSHPASNLIRFGQKSKSPHYWVNANYNDSASIENSYVKLNHDWLSSKETFDLPPPSSLLASPTTTSETCSNTNQTDHSSHLKPSAQNTEEATWQMWEDREPHQSQVEPHATAVDDAQTSDKVLAHGIHEGLHDGESNKEISDKILCPTTSTSTTADAIKMNEVTESHAIKPNEATENRGHQVEGGAGDVQNLDHLPNQGIELKMAEPSSTVRDPSLPNPDHPDDLPLCDSKRIEELIQSLIDRGFQPPGSSTDSSR